MNKETETLLKQLTPLNAMDELKTDLKKKHNDFIVWLAKQDVEKLNVKGKSDE